MGYALFEREKEASRHFFFNAKGVKARGPLGKGAC